MVFICFDLFKCFFRKTISFSWHSGDDFCWVDSVEIAFPKKLFRLVGPWGFVGIDSVENAFPKNYFV